MSSASNSSPDEVAPTGTHAVWARLRRPFDVVDAVDAVLGLSPNVARQLAGTVLATSDQAEALLDAMPSAVRSLAISNVSQMEECRGEIRGPVLWSETMARRSGSPSSHDVYVCAQPQRAYDVAENRVLVAALSAVREAGRRVAVVSAESYDDETLRRARHNGDRAVRYLEHRALKGVERSRPHPRDVRRARSGTRRATYGPALAMLDRSIDPLTADDIIGFCDRRTRAQHALLMTVVAALDDRGIEVPEFRAVAGTLEAGPVRFNHPRRRGDRSRPHGITVGSVLIDVPDRLRDRDRDRGQRALTARAGGLEAVVVLDPVDIDRALDLALRPAA